MERKDINILIVEDDATLGSALVQVLAKAGLRADHIPKVEDAQKAVRLTPYHIALIDCLLPKMNGVPLAENLKESLPSPSKILLMSGVFKDRTFIRDAVQKTGAVAFLQKPFDNDALLSRIEECLVDLVDAPKGPLFRVMTESKLKTRDIRKILESVEQISGFEIPLLISVVMEGKLSGHLNLVDEQGAVSGISFCNGLIQKVDIADSKTFLGEILIDQGFLDAADLADVTKTANERRIGQRLIETNLLSPHALSIAMREQMSLRLGMTVDPHPVRVNFVQGEVPFWQPYVGQADMLPYLTDWLVSKYRLDWLQAHYMEWMEHRAQLRAGLHPLEHVEKSMLVRTLPDFISKLTGAPSLAAASEAFRGREDDFFRALHLLVLTRHICFSTTREEASLTFHERRLQRVSNDLRDKNHLEIFEYFGTARRAKIAEIQSTYRDLSKIFHPDKLPTGAGQEMQMRATEIFSKITAAYKILSDETARAQYMQQLETEKAAKSLKAEEELEAAKDLVHRGQFQPARDQLRKIRKQLPDSTEVLVYFVWSELKLLAVGQASMPQEDIEKLLTRIPPEDRHNAVYYFVRGLIEKNRGQLAVAKRHFEHSTHLDPALVEAKRELSQFSSNPGAEKEFSILHSDLSTVIGKIFKK